MNKKILISAFVIVGSTLISAKHHHHHVLEQTLNECQKNCYDGFLSCETARMDFSFCSQQEKRCLDGCPKTVKSFEV